MDSEDSSGSELNRLTEIFRKAGLRVTPQRLRIFEDVVRSKDHPTAEELFRRLRRRMPTLSLDTVYRTLAALERVGVVVRLNIAQAASRFDGTLEPHHHIVCRRCNGIRDVVWEEFDRLPLPPDCSAWGEVEKRRVELSGLCRACMEKKEKEEAPDRPAPETLGPLQ